MAKKKQELTPEVRAARMEVLRGLQQLRKLGELPIDADVDIEKLLSNGIQRAKAAKNNSVRIANLSLRGEAISVKTIAMETMPK